MTEGRAWDPNLVLPQMAVTPGQGRVEFHCFCLKLSASWGSLDPQTLPEAVSRVPFHPGGQRWLLLIITICCVTLDKPLDLCATQFP